MPDESLSQQVYARILGDLLGKRLQPGDPVDRRRLARELGVSGSPVLGALNRLEHEGFVEIVPRRGTRIRSVRPDDFRGMLLVRNALECEAARLYCGAPVRRERDRLLALARTVDGGRSGSRIDWPAEIAFHRALVELVGCPGFLAEYDRVMRVGLFVLVNTFSLRNPFPPDPSGRWHADLVEGLTRDDPDAAEKAIREHVESGRAEFLRPEGI